MYTIPAVVISSAIGALTLNVRRIFLSIFTAFIGAVLIAFVINQLVAGGAIKVIGLFTDYNTLLGVFGVVCIPYIACCGVCSRHRNTARGYQQKKGINRGA